jgi:hypothetical protein
MADQNIKVRIDLDVAEFNKNIKELQDAISKVLGKEIKLVNANLAQTAQAADKAGQAMSNAGKSAGGTTDDVKKSNKAWTSLSLVIQDLPYGFRGIQNNLPALVGSFAAATGPIYLAFSALIAITTAYEKEIAQLIYGIDGAAIANKKMNEAISENIGQARSQIAVDKSLLSIINDTTKSTNVRTTALNELKKEYKGNLELQKLDINDGAKLYAVYNKISDALLRKARASAYASLIAEEEAKIFKLQSAQGEDVVKNLGFMGTSYAILSAGLSGFGASANTVNSAFAKQAKQINQSQNNIDLFTKKLNENTAAQIDNADATSIDTKSIKNQNGNKPVVSKSFENLAQEEFNYYKDSIFKAEEYFTKLNNIQKINALMEATIKGASADELFTIQQTYEQKALNFQKDQQSKLLDILHQGQQANKKISDDYNKEKLDNQVSYTENYIKSLDTQLKAELKLHRNNVYLQQEDVKNKIKQLEIAKIFAAGNVKAIETINAAISKLQGNLTGLGDVTTTVTSILSSTLQSAFEGVGQALGDLAVTGQFNFNILGAILADALISIGKALILYSSLVQAAKKAIESGKVKAGLIIGIAAVAAGFALKATMNKKRDTGPKEFANGGIISGPTLGLMGEYPGASSNPEVVAPLDKLKSLMGGGGGTLEARISGNDLLILMNKAGRNNNNTF